MNELIKLLVQFAKGKEIFPVVRLILNIILSISIAGFLFEELHGEYNIIDVLNFREIVQFFLKGTFFIPLLLFILFYTILDAVCDLVYKTVEFFLFRRIFLDVKKRSKSERGIIREFNFYIKILNLILPTPITKNDIINSPDLMNEVENENAIREIDKELSAFAENIGKNFNICVRIIIAACIFHHSLPYFDNFLFLTTIIITSLWIVSIFFANRFFQLLPELIRKFIFLAKSYKELQEQKIKNT